MWIVCVLTTHDMHIFVCVHGGLNTKLRHRHMPTANSETRTLKEHWVAPCTKQRSTCTYTCINCVCFGVQVLTCRHLQVGGERANYNIVCFHYLNCIFWTFKFRCPFFLIHFFPLLVLNSVFYSSRDNAGFPYLINSSVELWGRESVRVRRMEQKRGREWA